LTYTGLKPHSYGVTFSESGRCTASRRLANSRITARIGIKRKNSVIVFISNRIEIELEYDSYLVGLKVEVQIVQ